MTRMVDLTDAVEIPGEPTMFHSIVPPVLIPLPLRARPHKGKNIFFGLLCFAYWTALVPWGSGLCTCRVRRVLFNP